MPIVKLIRFTPHSREQLAERGASEEEVADAIRTGERRNAKRGRQAYRKNFQYDDLWGRRTYAFKQVQAIVAEQADSLIGVTVYTVYF